MTATARRNGWKGFDNIAEKVDGGWMYRCDGMPSMFGCGSSVVVSRRWSRIGEKKTGWLVIYGKCFPDEQADDEHGNDLDVVLTFCPSCAAVVREQDAREPQPPTREALTGASTESQEK